MYITIVISCMTAPFISFSDLLINNIFGIYFFNNIYLEEIFLKNNAHLAYFIQIILKEKS